ncbi:unnamed protein product [Diabrotica balteata]|uniref:Uncharacterized protein n=1 Tax=Diabrotica balteata TaxID=107213 RepID=A0A9N9T4F3_DIABA|nr:unnamed protein product [Diabrotica balteata]
MLADNRQYVREHALRRILKIRKTSNIGALRIFQVPTLNKDAHNYIDMIDWKTKTEPSLTMSISNEIITQAIIEPQLVENEILKNIRKGVSNLLQKQVLPSVHH